MGVLLEVGVLIEGMVFIFDFLVFLASPNNTPRRYKSGNTVVNNDPQDIFEKADLSLLKFTGN